MLVPGASMSGETLGIAMGLGTAVCWCFSSMAFEEAGRRAGSVPVNLVRLVVAFGFLSLAGWARRGQALPTDATAEQWRWLLWSGVIGFFVGDVTQFRALVLIGARLTSLVTCTAPIFAMVAERWLLRSGSVGWVGVAGVVVTLAGVAWVVSERNEAHPRYVVTPWGVLLAFIGAAGQGVGVVLTRRATDVVPYDAFATGQIRMIAGIALFAVFLALTGRTRDVIATLRNGPAMGYLSLGAFGGPFLGVTLLIMSMNHILPSVAQTLTSLVPILIIPFAIAFRNEKVSGRAVLGSVVAVAGVWLLIRGSSGG